MILALNIILCVIALIILIYLLERDLGLFLLSFMLLIQYIWMFFSITVIETGIFINEQGRNGYFTWSGVVLMLFYITTLLSLVFYKKLFAVVFKSLKPTKFSLKPIKDGGLATFLIGLVLCMAFFNLIQSPIPLFDKVVNKFNFWDYAKYPAIQSVVGNVMGFVGFGSAILYRYNKKISVFFLLLYITYLVLLGQKFTGFLIALYGIFLAFFFSSKTRIKFKLKWLFNRYLIILVVSLFSLVLYKYTQKNPFKYIGLTPLESVFYRAFGLQAHVFWGVTERYIFLGEPNSWDITELWKGMHVLMLEFWPWRYEDFISVTTRGVSWTNAYPSILIRIFPLPIALFVNFILLSVVGLFQALITKFIENKSFVMSIVFFQLLTWVSYTYTMAYFNKLTIPFLILVLYLTFKGLKFVGKKNDKQPQN